MRLLRSLFLLLVFVLVGFAGFVVWASSGTLPEAALATTTTYDVPAAPTADTLTVVTYNIGYLSGMTNNEPVERSPALYARHLDAATRMLDSLEADVVGFQEIDLGAARSYDVHQVDTLARRLGYHAAATAVNWDERYVPFPGAWYDPEHHFGAMRSGQALLSRYPIRQHERVVLPPMDAFDRYGPLLGRLAPALYLDRLAQVALIDVGQAAGPLAVINVHLEAFDAPTRERQARALRALVDRYRDAHPVLLIGDFNTPLPVDTTEATLPLLLDGTPFRPAIPDTLTPIPGTYPADAPVRKIDHIFYEQGEIAPVAAFVVDGTPQPSDHRAVALRFVLHTHEQRPSMSPATGP
jgi:endonuclease/exonuclease/phosphatase family metal-dependent hydrolase